MSTAASKKKVAIKKKIAPKRTTGFRVVSTSYPSATGCYYGQDMDDDYREACTTRRVVGEYDTWKQAVAAAIYERDRNCEFEDWAIDHYDDDEPPYESYIGNNFDDDEDVIIDIVDIGEQVDEENQALAKARSSKRPASRRCFGPQMGDVQPDLEVFLRHPCRIQGGQSHLPSKYGNHAGSERNCHAYLIQRQSDRNYTMRSVCLDQGGATYLSFTKRNVVCKCVAWLPDSNVNDHADDESIVDACHLDLVNHKNGNSYLTAETLNEAVHSGTTCIFVSLFNNNNNNNMGNEDNPAQALVDAIQTCASSLRCISLTESFISKEILQALASCPNLAGILLDGLHHTNNNNNDHAASTTANDDELAAVLRACPKLTWLYVDDNMFGTACWTALADCPNLEVLWVDSTTTSDNGRQHKAVGDVAVIRRVLASLSLSSLKLCMINPDANLESRYTSSLGMPDRLDGDYLNYEDSDDDDGDY